MKQRTLEEKQEIVDQMKKLRSEGMTVVEATKKLGLHTTTDHIRYAKQLERNGNGVPLRSIKHFNPGSEKMLKAENTRLRTMVVDLMLDVQALKEYHSR